MVLQQILVWLLVGTHPAVPRQMWLCPFWRRPTSTALSPFLADSVHIEDAEAVEQLREALHEALLEYTKLAGQAPEGVLSGGGQAGCCLHYRSFARRQAKCWPISMG